MLILRSFLFAGAVLAGLPSITPAAAFGLTVADGKSTDAVGEVIANPAGFVVAYTRLKTDPSIEISVRVRQFTPDGKRAGKELVVDRQASSLVEPIGIPIGSGAKVAAFWMRPASGVVARIGDTTTGALGAEKVFLALPADRQAEANMDVIPLSGGKFQLVTYRFDFSTGNHKRVAVTTIGPDLKVIAGPTFVPGPKASYVATAASDFTAIDTKDGGSLVAYRNRADGNVYVVKVGATGAVASTATRINEKSMPIGSGGQQTDFQVEAARLQNGRIVVTWTRIGSTVADDAFDVAYRVLSSTGAPLGKELRAHASAAEEQVAPEITALPDGGFALSWTNNGGPVAGRPRSYWTRSFKPDGTPRAAAKRLYQGDRAVNGNVAELSTNAHGRLVLVRANGLAPTTLQGILSDP